MTDDAKAELAAAIDPQWDDCIVIRRARKAHTCVGKREIRAYIITTTYGKVRPGNVTSSEWEAFSATGAAGWIVQQKRRYPDATFAVERRPNPNYRPDCLGDIAPGDLYVEYIGEAGFAESGRPYCQRCGLAAWGKRPNAHPVGKPALIAPPGFSPLAGPAPEGAMCSRHRGPIGPGRLWADPDECWVCNNCIEHLLTCTIPGCDHD